MGELFEQNQDLKKAIDYYKQSLRLAPEGSNNEKMTQKIKALEIQLQSPRDQEIRKSLDTAWIAYQNKNYQECLKQVEKVLILDPENVQAREYLKLANLNLGIKAYEEGNFEECIRQAKKVLNMDPKNEEAKKYLYLANKKIASKQITTIFNQYVQSVKNGTLSDFYKRVCTSELYQEKKEDAEMLFDFYIDLEWIPSQPEKNSGFRTLSGTKVIPIKKYEKKK